MKPTDALSHPADWLTTTVGKAVEVKRGISWSKEQEHSTPRDGAVPVIRIGNVQERLELDDLIYISGLKPKAVEKKRVSAGWSIMVGSNGNRQRIGNAVPIAQDTDFLFASFLIAARPKADSGVVPEFFYRWLSAERVQAYLSASSEGTTGLSNLSHTFFKAMAIPFPKDSKEQAAIARLLDSVDTALERTRTAIIRARDVKRALVQELFSKGTRKAPQKKTPLGYIPRSWEVVSVESVVHQFQYGLSVPMQLKGAIPILRMGNIQAGNVVFNELKYVTLPERFTALYLLKRGDVLFNRTNSQEWVGKVGIYRSDVPAVFASYLIRVVPEPEKTDNYFLGQLLDSYLIQCRIKRYATPGVQQVNINATNLGKVLIPLPTGETGLDEQREIAAILESADTVIRNYEPVLAAHSALKKSLMHDLLTGRVRVTQTTRPKG